MFSCETRDEIDVFGVIHTIEGRTVENADWRYVWLPELMQGGPDIDPVTGLSKLLLDSNVDFELT
jgi:hypothetical protein